MTRIVFLDLETTGLDPDRHEIYEIGLIVCDPHKGRAIGHTYTEYRWWRTPNLYSADATALRIGRYWERMPEFPHEDCRIHWLHGQDWVCTNEDSVATHIAALTAGAHIVGAVPSFDDRRLGDWMRANGACPSWHYHLVDVEALAAGKLDLAPPWDTDQISTLLGITRDTFEPHTALGDCRWAYAVYHAVLSRAALS